MMIGLLFGVALGASSGSPITDNRIPEAALISTLEDRVVMPAGAGPLASYDRSYTEATVNGRDVVLGQMIDRSIAEAFAKDQHRPPPPAIQRVLITDMVPAFDGGCAILTVYYDVVAGGAPKVSCNPTGPL